MRRRLRELIEKRAWAQFLPDFQIGLQNLMLHKLRSLLTMLGMIFGVAAVIAMLSIGAGARQQVMAFIEQMGVRNLIVEAKDFSDQEYEKIRKISQGLSFQDFRIINANVSGLQESTPRKRFTPNKMLPKPQRDMPVIYSVNPNYQKIMSLHLVAGRFFDQDETDHGATVAVVGQAAALNLFGQDDPVGRYLKCDELWLRIIGVVGPQLSAQTTLEGVPSQDLNNVIYIPLNTGIMRIEDRRGLQRDEVDGLYFQLASAGDSVYTGEVVRGILNASHHNAGDFSIIVPAELLAEQRRTQRIFDLVMVAIASISLLVGGIGIMNIMLANILERTREIGVRRAIGAKRRDVIQQFLVEAVLISLAGGIIGILFGFGISRLIAWLAGWSTIMTISSIALAFLFSVSVGLVFGIYPAMKAAKLDPVEAIRYE